MEWNNVRDRLPPFDSSGWSHNILFWDGDTLYSGSCQNRGGNPVFIDWWVGGCDVDADWWAPWPKKPTAEQSGTPAEQTGNSAMDAISTVRNMVIERGFDNSMPVSEALYKLQWPSKQHQ